MGKYDTVFLRLIIKGHEVGQFVIYRTARQAAEERWHCSELRKQFQANVDSANSAWRVPIFGGMTADEQYDAELKLAARNVLVFGRPQ